MHTEQYCRASGIIIKTSFKTRVSQMGLGSFVNINVFVLKNHFFQFVYILNFFESLKSKSTQMLKPKKKENAILFSISGSELLYRKI